MLKTYVDCISFEYSEIFVNPGDTVEVPAGWRPFEDGDTLNRRRYVSPGKIGLRVVHPQIEAVHA